MSLTRDQLDNFSLHTFVNHSVSLHCALLSWFHLPSDGENLVLLPLLFWPHPAQLARDRQGWKDINVDKCSCNPVFKPCSPSKKDSLPSSRSKRKGDQGQRWSRGEPSIGSARAWWWCKKLQLVIVITVVRMVILVLKTMMTVMIWCWQTTPDLASPAKKCLR